MIKLDNDWLKRKSFISLAQNDANTLQTKVKKFLKHLFKLSSVVKDDQENGVKQCELSEDEICEQLGQFEKLLGKVSKREECSSIIDYIFDLIIGHSRIREILISGECRQSKLRFSLIKLFCNICSARIVYCKNSENLVDLILSAYDATLSKEDQHLLQLFSLLESSGVNLQRYHPFIWGLNGAVFYAAKHAQKLAFLQYPSIDEMFQGFDGRALHQSLAHFPIEISMTDRPIEILSLDDPNRYDPRFLMPVFYHFLSSESIVKCHKFISYGALSYTIAALSSECARMRAVAYRVLSRFYSHLECASYPQDRQLWIGLIDYLRSGLTTADQRIDSIHTVLIVRIIEVLLKPLSPVFLTIRSYLISQQTQPYQLGRLSPLYSICMHSVTASNPKTYQQHQRFVLTWITDALRTDRDVRLCHNARVFSDLLTYYNSPLCIADNRPLILKLITRLADQVEGLKALCFDCAIFSWIKHQLLVVPQIEYQSAAPKDHLFWLVLAIWKRAFEVHQARLESAESPPSFIFYKSFCFEVIDVMSRIVYKANERFRIEAFIDICHKATLYSDEPMKSLINQTILSNIPQNIKNIAENGLMVIHES